MGMCIVITALAFPAMFQYTRIYFFYLTVQHRLMQWSYWEKISNVYIAIIFRSQISFPEI